MAKVCTYWEGWATKHNSDLLAGEEDLLVSFAQSLAADAETKERLLERYGSRRGGSGDGNVSEDLHSDLVRLTEKNRELRAAIEAASIKLQRRKETYQQFKQDQKLLSHEVKETYEALLMANKYYKKHLKLYYTLEPGCESERIVLVQFFTERKNENDQFSLRLKRNVKTGKNELLDMTPMLATFKAIKKRLADTNDVPGALTCIYQSFCNVRGKK